MSQSLREMTRQHVEHIQDGAGQKKRRYDDADEVNLTGYAASLTAFALAAMGLVLAGRTQGQHLPERYELADIAIGGLATQKFTRLLGKASVTSPIRAPFTEFEEPAGSAEHVESARGGGVRHTIGELLTCPFCLAQWVGTGYVAGLALAPRQARAWGAVFAVTAVADALQHVYDRLRSG